MPRWKKLTTLTFIALIQALMSAMLGTPPAAARVDLDAGKGEAVWFSRSCNSGQAGDAARWVVGLNPSVPNRSSLGIRVENAYPGYRLLCDLHFANSGKIPIAVKDISIVNPNPGDLKLSVVVPPGEAHKTLQPCGYKLTWGNNPAGLPLDCWTKIELALAVGPQVGENSRLDFVVQVRLEEMPGSRNP